MSYRNTWSITGATSITSLKDSYKWNNESRLKKFGMLRLDTETEGETGTSILIQGENKIPLMWTDKETTYYTSQNNAEIRYYGIPGYLVQGKTMHAIGSRDTATSLIEDGYNHKSMKYDTEHSPSKIENWNFYQYPNIINFLNGFNFPDTFQINLNQLRTVGKVYYTYSPDADGTKWCAQDSENDANSENFLIAKYSLSENSTFSNNDTYNYYSFSEDSSNLNFLVNINMVWNNICSINQSSKKFWYKNAQSQVVSKTNDFLWIMLFYPVNINHSYTSDPTSCTLSTRYAGRNYNWEMRAKISVQMYSLVYSAYYAAFNNTSLSGSLTTVQEPDTTVTPSFGTFRNLFNCYIQNIPFVTPTNWIHNFLEAVRKTSESFPYYRENYVSVNYLSYWSGDNYYVQKKDETEDFLTVLDDSHAGQDSSSISHWICDISENKFSLECPIILSSEPVLSFERIIDNRQSNLSYAYKVYWGPEVATVANTGGSITFDVYEGNIKLQAVTITLNSDSDSSGGVPIKKNGVTVAYIAWDGINHSGGVPGSIVCWTQEEQEQGSFGHWLGFNANGFGLMPLGHATVTPDFSTTTFTNDTISYDYPINQLTVYFWDGSLYVTPNIELEYGSHTYSDSEFVLEYNYTKNGQGSKVLITRFTHNGHNVSSINTLTCIDIITSKN